MLDTKKQITDSYSKLILKEVMMTEMLELASRILKQLNKYFQGLKGKYSQNEGAGSISQQRN